MKKPTIPPDDVLQEIEKLDPVLADRARRGEVSDAEWKRHRRHWQVELSLKELQAATLGRRIEDAKKRLKDAGA